MIFGGFIFSCDEQLKKSTHSFVTKEFFLSLKYFQGVKGCLKLKEVSRMFQGSFREISRVFQESFN